MIKTSLYMVVIGASTGWLIGLSISSIIGGIITSVISLLISIYVVFIGIPNSNELNIKSIKNIDLSPLALLLISIVLGSSLGIYTRTNNILGMNPNSFINKWEKTKIEPQELAKLALKIQYGTDNKENEPTNYKKYNYGVLFNSNTNIDCDLIKETPDSSLKNTMYRLNNDHVDRFIENCNSNINCLKAGLNSFICPGK